MNNSILERGRGDLPLYERTRAAIEEYVLQQEFADDEPIPPESVLVERLGVSRGTLRRALAELEQDGLLIRESGRGTFVDPAGRVRHLVRSRLLRVAVPDSRFDMDFRRFAPDFIGSDECHRRLLQLDQYKKARTIYITPDNALGPIRVQALEDEKIIVAGTYEMRRGFYALRPEMVPQADRPFAATLDGQEKFGESLSLASLRDFGSIDMVVTGAPAVSEDGYYFGRGVGYLYLEWGLLRELGIVHADTPVVAVVHDCQVVPKSALQRSHDCILDTIITPTQLFERKETDLKPNGINWSKLPTGVSSLPYFMELLDARSATLI